MDANTLVQLLFGLIASLLGIGAIWMAWKAAQGHFAQVHRSTSLLPLHEILGQTAAGRRMRMFLEIEDDGRVLRSA
nr:hypothetical protein B0A51_05660 [Rachicladosporium sp. CCFEE 5018]